MRYLDDMIKENSEISILKNDIEKAIDLLEECFKKGNKLLICGNGGSASDSAHITGELMKSFVKKRKISDDMINNLKKICTSDELDLYNNYLEQGLPCIDLTAFCSLNTAFINDTKSELLYANSVLGLGKEGDVLLSITTSGNSKNILHAVNVAKAKNIKTIALTGKSGGKIKDMVDISIISPKKDTYKIQEDHIKIYHTICLEIEDKMF
ncbi:MAG: SIS domain-containing protein [Lachnospiraceae bacterium]|nr:SIS domain-containing protein [Lachnospiraceae bacterium]